MEGTIVNALAVLGGGLTGLRLRRRLPGRTRQTAMQAIGLVSLLIGAAMALETRSVLGIIISLVLGG